MAEKTTNKKKTPGRKKTLSVIMNNGIPISKETGEMVDIKAVAPTHEVRIIDTNEDSLSTGVAINTYDKTSIDYLKDLKEFSTRTDDIKKQIKLCNKLYKIDGTVSTALDVLIDFTTSEYTFKTDEKYEDLFRFYGKSINKTVKTSDTGLRPLLQQLALEWFLSGNAFPYSTWKRLPFEGKDYFLPSEIQLLNPKDIFIPSYLFSQQQPVYVYRPLYSSFKGNSLIDQQVLMESDSVETIRGQLGAKEKVLEDDRIYHLKRRARSYDIWGIPYLVKTFNVVASKMKLRALDNATTEGAIGYLTIFKIGSTDKDSPYHVVPSSRLNAFAGMIKYPQASTTLVWPHDIEVETAGPNSEILNFENKYDEVNAELVRALGVPQILLDGKGTATASWVAILSLVERLERVRDSLKEYIDHLFEQIIERNNLKTEAEFSWFPINLRDEKMVKTLLMSFYDKGLLPIKTTLKEGGYDPNAIIEEMELEKDNDKFEELFKRRDIPFSPVPEEVKPKKESPENNGRPKENMEVSNDKYVESLFEIYNEFRDKIKKQPEITDSGLKLMKRRLEQVIEAYTSSVLDQNSVFSAKVNVWNGKYLDKLVAKIKSEIGNKPDKFRVEGVFSEFEGKLSLFSSESIKNIDLAVTLAEQKELGKKGAIIKVSKDTKCDSCKSYDGNFYTLEDIFGIIPIHPNQEINLEFTDNNPIVEGERLNTPVVKHPRNFSKIL